jgi:hypothetical protein
LVGVESPYSEVKISSITAISSITNKIVDLIDRPIYIGSSFVPQNIESSKNYFYNKAVIYFTEIDTNEITVTLEQSDYNDILAQHLFWQPYSNISALSSLDNLTRFDPAALRALGYQDVQYNVGDLVPNILRPNSMKDQSSLTAKKVNITYKQMQKAERYLITFNRLDTSPTPTLKKHYFTNPALAYQTLAKQQELAATLDINSAFEYESLESAQQNKEYIQDKISSSQWSGSNFIDISIETIKSDLAPKSLTSTISLKRKFEVYPAKRFAIGLRSIDVSYSSYASKAEIVSKPFTFGYNVKNITISADTSFNLQNGNSNQNYIKYYISLDDGKKWIQISPIENPFIGIPEILSFNENIQNFGQVKGVSYLNAPEIPVDTKNIRVKIEIEKPRYENTTPVIYSYQIAGRVEQI